MALIITGREVIIKNSIIVACSRRPSMQALKSRNKAATATRAIAAHLDLHFPSQRLSTHLAIQQRRPLDVHRPVGLAVSSGADASTNTALSLLGPEPLLDHTEVVRPHIGGEDLREDIGLAPISQAEILQQGVHIRDLIEDEVWKEAAVAVWGAIACVLRHQCCFVEDGLRPRSDCKRIVQVCVRPETLQFHARGIRQIAEHGDEREGMVAIFREAWGCNCAVQPEGSISRFAVHAGVERLDFSAGRTPKRTGEEAREACPDRGVGAFVDGGPELMLLGCVG